MRKVLMLAIGICFVLSGSSFAFHDAGVADCAGCHTMHNSEDGALVDINSPNGNAWLLKDATPSDVCLSCHSVSSSRGVFGADVLTPNALNGALPPMLPWEPVRAVLSRPPLSVAQAATIRTVTPTIACSMAPVVPCRMACSCSPMTLRSSTV